MPDGKARYPMPRLNPVDLPRRVKRAVTLAIDTALVPIAPALRYGTMTPPVAGDIPFFAALSVIGFALLVGFCTPWIELRTPEFRALAPFAMVAGLITMAAMACS